MTKLKGHCRCMTHTYTRTYTPTHDTCAHARSEKRKIYRPPVFQPRAATVGTGGVRNYVPKNIEIASGFEDQPRCTHLWWRVRERK